MKNSVNKNFIYTWKEESIPKKYVKNIESWMKYHNDWTFLFFSDKIIDLKFFFSFFCLWFVEHLI